MRRGVIEDEGVLEGDGLDRPTLRAEPPRGRKLLTVETGEGGLDRPSGELDDDWLRYPC